jgi:hypothetical protein
LFSRCAQALACSELDIRLAEFQNGETQCPQSCTFRAVNPSEPFVTTSTLSPLAHAQRLLTRTASLWFIVATLGQWAFVAFIVMFYGGNSVQGNFAALNSKPHITGYVPGDSLGNTQWLLHIFIAAIVTFAGVLQLLPQIRQRWPALHRWNGRVFMVGAILGTLTGFYLTWIRGSQLNLPSAISISINGLLILVFATLAWRSAWQRNIAAHRRHALRAYLLVNGVWFLRISIVPVALVLSTMGIQMGLDSPAFLIVSIGSWLVPIAVLQLYFVAQQSQRVKVVYSVSALFVFLALLTLAGSIAAVALMWWPYL